MYRCGFAGSADKTRCENPAALPCVHRVQQPPAQWLVPAEKLKQIWLQPDYDSAKKYADGLMNEYEGKYPQAIATLEEGLEESLQFFNFRQIDARKIASTNLLERLNREIRRRTKVVGIFPSMDSYIRLVTSYLIEYSEDWSSGRSYINPMLINEIQQQLSKSA